MYCDHKPLALFLIKGMKSQTMDRWAPELQQYNVKFKQIAGKENYSSRCHKTCLKAVNLYEELEDHEVLRTPETIDSHHGKSHPGNTSPPQFNFY